MTNIYADLVQRSSFPSTSIRAKYFPLQGGENLTDAALSISPGNLIFGKNYEVYAEGGYRRIDGFERFDGRTKPSESSYYILDFKSGTVTLTDTTVITGATSGATAELVADAVLESGTYAGSDAQGYYAVALLSGTFQVDENIQVSSVTKSVVKAVVVESGADTDALEDTYSQAAEERARGDIGAVPGSGDILGVWVYNGTIYAIRNNAGGTAAAMYKSSSTGWTLIDLGKYIKFDAGVATVAEGATITGATSGATGVMRREAVLTGSFGSGSAEGLYVLTGVSGTFQNNENLQVSSSTVSVSDGTLVTTVLTPSGRYEFTNYNFGGSTTTNRMYGCDGKNVAFEFDGTYWVPIFTGMTTDTPVHITAHKKHLFLSFDKGSVQHSSLGTPYTWSLVTGANEIGTGDEVTGFQVLPSDVLAIFNRNRTYMLYGTSNADWNLQTFSNETGAVEYTIQRLSNVIYLDDRGITDLNAVQAFGDFAAASLSKKIKPVIDSKKGTAISSVRVRSKDQYRIFFSDGSGLYGTFSGGRLSGFIRTDLGKVVKTVCSAEDSNGDEVLFFGSTDGYVYQMDKGNSFDGTAVEALLRTSYYHYDSPTRDKRFRKIHFELTADTDVSLVFTPDYSYADPETPAHQEKTLSITGGGGYWNISNWNSFNWTNATVSTSEENIDGIGTNMGILILSEATYEKPHIVQGVTVHYSPRRTRR